MDLNLNIQYLTDAAGNKTAVLIPVEEWEKFKENYLKLVQRQKLKSELNEGLKDIYQSLSDKHSRVSLEQFLNES